MGKRTLNMHEVEDIPQYRRAKQGAGTLILGEGEKI